MEYQESKKGAAYFRELSLRFHREGVEHGAPADGIMPILQNGERIGAISESGGIILTRDKICDLTAGDPRDRAGQIAAEVKRYMTLMETAPPLTADGLDMPYRLLASFDDVVLGGMESTHGMQFTTWQRTYDRQGLTVGHYYGGNFSGALRDFAQRAGFFNGLCLFSEEQLAEISHCCSYTLENFSELTYEQEKDIQEIQEQIQGVFPEQQTLTEDFPSQSMKF